ncbi:MAG: ChbG/HpnK family deacetylase [bacterium]
MTERFLFINADDAGFSIESLDPLTRLVNRGIVTGCSLVPNAPDVDAFVRSLSKTSPDPDLGVHLNLTEGAPLLPAEKVRSLVGEDGRFLGFRRFFFKWITRRLDPRDAAREAEAQFGKMSDFAVPLIHADSHHNVHLLPGIAETVSEIARKNGITWFRSSSAPFHPLSWTDTKNLGYAAYNSLARFSANCYRRSGLRPGGAAFQLDFKKDTRPLLSLRRALSSVRDGTAELVCHPAFSGYDTKLPRRELQRRKDELEFLLGADAGAILDGTGFTLSPRGKTTRRQAPGA